MIVQRHTHSLSPTYFICLNILYLSWCALQLAGRASLEQMNALFCAHRLNVVVGTLILF